MAVGSVAIVQRNESQGEFKEVERTFLFVGSAAEGAQTGILSVGAGSDLDALLGSGASNLKTQIAAAIANAGDAEFFAYALPVGASDDWTVAVLAALEKPFDLNVEGVVYCDPVTAADDVEAAQAMAQSAITNYAKFLTVCLGVSGIASSESWSEYVARVKAVVNGVTADRVSVVPLLHGNNLGAVVGRLCNPAASIADTPMKVATGPVYGLGADPVDKNDAPLDMPTIKILSEARLSVPQWYAGYDGIYWADHPLLDAEGGEFQVIEHRRVLDYVARRVRVRAIRRIGDRRLNNTAISVSQNKTYFSGPVRDASKSTVVSGVEYPGLIEPPDDDCVEIVWSSTTEVAISITVKPYHCPKKITVTLGLDLSND